MSQLRARMRVGRFEISAEGEVADVFEVVNTFTSYVKTGAFDDLHPSVTELEQSTPQSAIVKDEPSERKRIGEKIRHARDDKGLTQKELAAAIGKDVSTVRRYENGEIKLRTSVAAQIADALGIWIDEIL